MLRARCKEFCTMQRSRRKEHQCQKYKLGLLTRKIWLWDVPESLRRDPAYARGIYIAGFRADRMVSKEHYKYDLLRLETEISLVEAEGKHSLLLEQLQTLSGVLQHNLSLFDLYDISDFH